MHHYFGDAAAIWIFGSRLDDAQKGVDVDLHVEAGPHRLLNELCCKIGPEERLDMPVNIYCASVFRSFTNCRHCKKTGTKVVSETVPQIKKKLEHLHRMSMCIDYFFAKTKPLMSSSGCQSLTPRQHKSLAAFRVQFNDYRNQFGKTMQWIACEQVQNTAQKASCLH